MKQLTVRGMGLLMLALLFTPLYAQDKPVDTTPKWNAYIRAWHQSDLTGGSIKSSQFLIKEARFGFNGNVNEYVSYKFLVDAAKIVSLTTATDSVPNSTKGKLFLKSASAGGTDFLQDAAVDIMPTKALALTLGQFKVPFSTDNNRSGAVTDFANRPFITLVSPSIRDMGFMTTYKFAGSVPVEINAGLFNGTGADKKENDRTTDYVARGAVKPIKDLGLSAHYYGGKVGAADLAMMNFGADWKVGPVFLDGEYGTKSLKNATTTTTSNAYFVYATYTLPFDNMMVTNIIPAVRYDAYDANTSKSDDEFSRITVGLTVTFAKISFAHFRLNYEKFNYADSKIPNPDMIVAEFQTRF